MIVITKNLENVFHSRGIVIGKRSGSSPAITLSHYTMLRVAYMATDGARIAIDDCESALRSRYVSDSFWVSCCGFLRGGRTG